ncbi:hypothetical protein [Bradyrhizobium sp. USDA 3364]
MIVYFSCGGCGATYAVVQERRAISVVTSGAFKCERCGKAVHHWSGMYAYSDWKYLGSRDDAES